MTTAAELSLAEIDALRREHEDAVRQWRDVRVLERELLTKRAWKGSTVTDDVSWTLARAELDEEKRVAAARFRDASARVHAANVAAANLKLSGLRVRYEATAETLTGELHRFEAAWCTLVDCGWALLDAAEAERRAAGRLVRTAQSASPNEEASERIRQAASYQAPVEVDAEGPSEWADRPELALFSGNGATADPRKDVMWETLGRLVRAGRSRGAAHVGGHVLSRIEKAGQQRQR